MRFLLLIALAVTAFPTKAQDILWQKIYGGDWIDHPSTIVTAPDGDIYWFGCSISSNGDAVGNHGSFDAFVVKTDGDGNKKWSKSYGGSGWDYLPQYGRSAVLVNNRLYAVGRIDSLYPVVTNGTTDVWMIALDTAGNLLWQRNFGGSGSDGADCILDIGNGRLLIGGSSQSDDGDLTGNYGLSDAWVIMVDTLGNLIWQKNYGGSESEGCYDLASTDDGGFLMVGSTGSSNGDVSGLHGASDGWAVKLDSLGNVVWQRCYGGSNVDYLTNVAKSGSYFYLTGQCHSTDGDIIDPPHFISIMNYGDALLFKIDSSGNLIWQRCFGGTDLEMGRRITATIDGGCLLGVETFSNNDYDVAGNHGNPPSLDAWAVKVDPDGDLVWQRCLGSSAAEYFHDAVQLPNGEYLLALSTFNQIDGYVVNSGFEYNNFWLVKLKAERGLVKGSVYADATGNCTIDTATDVMQPAVLVYDSVHQRYASTNALGYYTMPYYSGETMHLAAVINPIQQQLLQPVCPTGGSHILSADTLATNDRFDFSFQPHPCAVLTVAINATPVRPCFDGSAAFTYCNQGVQPVANATVTIELPQEVTLLSASVGFTFDVDSNAVFNVGTLDPGECGTVYLQTHTACSATLGTTLCFDAHITPLNWCFEALDPQYALWDSSDLSVTGWCANDSVVKIFIYNGGVDMPGFSRYRLYDGYAMFELDSFQLQSGDTFALDILNQDFTRIEVDQRPGHPFAQTVWENVNACVGGAFDALAFSDFDTDVAYDVHCGLVTASMDPNVKDVSPAGLFEEHYVAPGIKLDYTVRFQNTGTDTAFRVIILDTLSDRFDLSTFEIGTASHAFTYDVSGDERPVLEFLFENILLPDSNTNEAASHGFVTFRIAPKANLAPGTRVDNFTDIYFDFNAPVRTPTAFVTLFDTTLVDTSERHRPVYPAPPVPKIPYAFDVSVFPVPAVGDVTLSFAQPLLHQSDVKLTDMAGRELFNGVVPTGTLQATVPVSSLAAGVYSLRVISAGESRILRLLLVR